jgi:hypothetical protein
MTLGVSDLPPMVVAEVVRRLLGRQRSAWRARFWKFRHVLAQVLLEDRLLRSCLRDHVGETRVVPIPHRIYEQYTHVTKEEAAAVDFFEVEENQRREPPQELEH